MARVWIIQRKQKVWTFLIMKNNWYTVQKKRKNNWHQIQGLPTSPWKTFAWKLTMEPSTSVFNVQGLKLAWAASGWSSMWQWSSSADGARNCESNWEWVLKERFLYRHNSNSSYLDMSFWIPPILLWVCLNMSYYTCIY